MKGQERPWRVRGFRERVTGLAALFIFGAAAANGQTRWIGSDGGSWSVSGNWDGGLPSASIDTVVGYAGLPAPSVVITQSVAAATKNLVIGDNTTAALTMDGASLTVSGYIGLGADTTSPYGSGTLIQNGGSVYATGDLSLPYAVWCTGVYQLNAGSLSVNNFNLRGDKRYGSLQIGETASFTVRGNAVIERNVVFPAGADIQFRANMYIPNWACPNFTVTHLCTNTYVAVGTSLRLADVNADTRGVYNVYGGRLLRQNILMSRKSGGVSILNAASNTTVRLGNGSNTSEFLAGENGGQATINLGDAHSVGWLELANYNTLKLRMDASSSATMRGVGGWKSGSLSTFEQNGRVIADAWGGENRDLLMPPVSTFANTLENAVTEANGWYAVNGGRLVFMASRTVGTGNVAYNWGEPSSDTAIDLVNSARLEFVNVAVGGVVRTYLLAVDRDDIPSPAQLGLPVAIHHLNSDAALAFDSLTLTIRYDAPGCEALGYTAPVILHSTGGLWRQIPSTLDPENKRISVTVTSLSGDDYFAQVSHQVFLGTTIAIK